MVKYTYDAWGKVLSNTGSLASTLGTVQPFRYRGYVYDVETELYYLRSRYYNPLWGRFINTDNDILISCENDLLLCNLFHYCRNNPTILFDDNGCFPLPNWLKVTLGVVIVAGLAVATVCTGGAAGVVCAAALSGATVGGASGMVIGAVTGGISDGWQGALDGACSGFLNGAIIGGATGALTAGISIATNTVEVIGSAQKTGTLLHRAASNIEATKMVLNPIKYSRVTLNRSLNTAGLVGRRIPDVIGIARDGSSLLIEVVSRSQTYEQMANKCSSMCNQNPGSSYNVITWAKTIDNLIK